MKENHKDTKKRRINEKKNTNVGNVLEVSVTKIDERQEHSQSTSKKRDIQ